MASASGRFTIVFNGEIYNHQELRKELIGLDPNLRFKGRSDTEVMLAAFERWGLRSALERFNGMFAFALLDRDNRWLHLVRDRIGEKPLYFARMGKSFIFGSEIKALKRHPAWSAEIDRAALSGYLRYAYVGGPGSIYKDVQKVLPGSCVTLSVSANELSGLRYEKFWSAEEIVSRGLNDPLELSDREALDRMTETLTDAIKLRMVADVPLGAFLSGGIDSSTVVAIMQRLSSRPVRTFSIGFGEKRFNEAESAKAVAEYLGTDHVELYVTPQDSLNVIPDLPAMFDEPFADASQIPTYLVSQLARGHVTVSLSGDGGDELFCGYERYELARQLTRSTQRVPRWLRTAAAASIRSVPIQVWNFLGTPLPERISAGRTGDRLYKLAQRFTLNGFPDIVDSLLGMWDEPQEVLCKHVPHSSSERAQRLLRTPGTQHEQMMALDLSTYLPDDILVKVDRASMAVSLEARVPLLDHRVVELAWRLPMAFKRRNGVSKWLLRQILYGMVPKTLVDRPKQGFSVPIEQWLRKELRDWACDLLAPDTIRRDGFFNDSIVTRHLDEHLSGRRSWASQLWAILMFQAWLHTT